MTINPNNTSIFGGQGEVIGGNFMPPTPILHFDGAGTFVSCSKTTLNQVAYRDSHRYPNALVELANDGFTIDVAVYPEDLDDRPLVTLIYEPPIPAPLTDSLTVSLSLFKGSIKLSAVTPTTWISGDPYNPLQRTAATAATIPLEQWSFITVTCWGVDGMAIYLNGQRQLQLRWEVFIPANHRFLFGKRGDSFFKGYMKNISIWRGIRSASDIEQDQHKRLATAEIQAAESQGLGGYWPLDEGVGNVVKDLTAVQNDGIIQNARWDIPIKDLVDAMLRACPKLFDDSIGSVARRSLVVALESATPGNLPDGNKGPYANFFFPGASHQDSWVVYSNIAEVHWSDFAIAVICRAAYDLHEYNRDVLKIHDIDKVIAAENATLNSYAVAWYAFVFSQQCAEFAGPYKATGDRARALARYTEIITSEPWVTAKETQWASGQWPERTWELFHHWVKLSLLGATDPQIDDAITTAIGLGLPVPPEVDAGKWRAYRGWLGSEKASIDLTWRDLAPDARTDLGNQAFWMIQGGPGCKFYTMNCWPPP